MKKCFLQFCCAFVFFCTTIVVHAQDKRCFRNVKVKAPDSVLVKQFSTANIAPGDEIIEFQELKDGTMILPSYKEGRPGATLTFIDPNNKFATRVVNLVGKRPFPRKVLPLRDGNVFVIVTDFVSDDEEKATGHVYRPDGSKVSSFDLKQGGWDAFEDPKGNLLVQQVHGLGEPEERDHVFAHFNSKGDALKTVKLPKNTGKIVQSEDGSFFSVIDAPGSYVRPMMLMNSDGSERVLVKDAKTYYAPRPMNDGSISVVALTGDDKVKLMNYSTSGKEISNTKLTLNRPVGEPSSESDRFHILNDGTVVSYESDKIAYTVGKDNINLFRSSDGDNLSPPIILNDGKSLLRSQLNDNRNKLTILNPDGSRYLNFETQMDPIDYRTPAHFKQAKDGTLWFTGFVGKKRVIEIRKIVADAKEVTKKVQVDCQSGKLNEEEISPSKTTH